MKTVKEISKYVVPVAFVIIAVGGPVWIGGVMAVLTVGILFIKD